MTAYAQTNIQLYNQLLCAGWNDTDCATARAAHDLAASISCGQLRPNYKPFLAHLVGAASIVATHAQRVDHTCCQTTTSIRLVDLVAAALLHSAYLLGNFGDRRRSPPEIRRHVVRATIGDVAEQVVHRFASISARMEEFLNQCRQFAQLSEIEQATVTVKLADIHEEYLDQGVVYSPCKQLGAEVREVLLTTTTIAGGTAWTASLQSAFAAADARSVSAVLVSTKQQSFVPSPPLHVSMLQRLRWRWSRRASAA